MSADTPDVLTACECGHSIDRHHAGTQRGECRTYNCFCTLKPSDVFAARVAAERERAEAKVAAVKALLIPESMRDNYAGSLYTLGQYDLSEKVRAALGGEATP